MKISVNGQPLFEISATQKKVICNDIYADEFDDDMKRRLQSAILSKYQACFRRLKKEWDTKLKDLGVMMVPTNENTYAELVFSQPTYKDRKAREPRDPNEDRGK